MKNLSVGVYKPSRNYWHIKFANEKFSKYFNGYILYVNIYDGKKENIIPLFTNDDVINANTMFLEPEFLKEYKLIKNWLQKTPLKINIKFLDYCENFEKRLSPENKLLLEVSD